MNRQILKLVLRHLFPMRGLVAVLDSLPVQVNLPSRFGL